MNTPRTLGMLAGLALIVTTASAHASPKASLPTPIRIENGITVYDTAALLGLPGLHAERVSTVTDAEHPLPSRLTPIIWVTAEVWYEKDVETQEFECAFARMFVDAGPITADVEVTLDGDLTVDGGAQVFIPPDYSKGTGRAYGQTPCIRGDHIGAVFAATAYGTAWWPEPFAVYLHKSVVDIAFQPN